MVCILCVLVESLMSLHWATDATNDQPVAADQFCYNINLRLDANSQY